MTPLRATLGLIELGVLGHPRLIIQWFEVCQTYAAKVASPFLAP